MYPLSDKTPSARAGHSLVYFKHQSNVQAEVNSTTQSTSNNNNNNNKNNKNNTTSALTSDNTLQADDQLLLIGGYTGEERLSDMWTLQNIDIENSTLSFQEEKPSFSQNKTAFAERAGHICCQFPQDPQKWAIFGGYDSARNVLGDLWVLENLKSDKTQNEDETYSMINSLQMTRKDVGGNSTVLATLPRRWSAASFIDPSHLLISFGWNKSGARGDLVSLDFSNMDKPIASEIIPKCSGALPVARRWHTSTFSPLQEKLFLFGGYIGEHLAPKFDLNILDTHEMRWTVTNSSPTSLQTFSGWCRHSSTLLGKSMVVCGGIGDKGKILKGIHVLHLDDLKWSHFTNHHVFQAERAGHSAVSVSDHQIFIYGGMNSKGLLDDAFVLDMRMIK